ncbi:hypothetical protein PENTCL1PPCAC_30253, partial [Pristionchus entomophagus]
SRSRKRWSHPTTTYCSFPSLNRPSRRAEADPGRTVPGRKMTAIKTPAPLKEEAAATSLSAARMKREEKTPPRSRSSSRSRKTQLQLLSGAAATTPTKQPPKLQQMPAVQPKIQAVLNFDDSPVITRRSIRIASKSPARNGHANGSGVQEIKDGRATIGMPVVARETTEQWRDKFTEEHPIFTKKFIPAMICLVYAMLFIVPCYYFDLHKKAPVWLDMAAQSISDMYDNFMAKRAASSAASAAAAAADSI